jgi:hypothetical protein
MRARYPDAMSVTQLVKQVRVPGVTQRITRARIEAAIAEGQLRPAATRELHYGYTRNTGGFGDLATGATQYAVYWRHEVEALLQS